MIADFVTWLKNPLATASGSPSALALFLAVGIVLVSMALWYMIFRSIRENIT